MAAALIIGLASIGLDRTQVCISNTVFWRPPGNRTPTTVAAPTEPPPAPPPPEEVTRQLEVLQARLEELRQGGEASQEKRALSKEKLVQRQLEDSDDHRRTR